MREISAAFQIPLLILSKFKGALPSLRQFLETENPLKLIKSAF